MLDRVEISSEMLAGGVRIVKPEGILDVFTFSAFKDFLSATCNQAGDIDVVVDLSLVPYISSSGWSVLLSERLALQRLGGDLSIFGLGTGPQRVYESMRISKMLPAATDAVKAVKLLHPAESA